MKKKIILIIVTVCLWISINIVLILNNEYANMLLNIVENNKIIAILILFTLQLTASLLILPVTPITITAGLIWGIEKGLYFSLITTFICSSVTFYIGANIDIKYYTNFFSNKYNILYSINQFVVKYGNIASVFCHANPFLPGSSLGYYFGLIRINFYSFIIGAMLGSFPVQLIMVFIGKNSNLLYS